MDRHEALHLRHQTQVLRVELLDVDLLSVNKMIGFHKLVSGDLVALFLITELVFEVPNVFLKLVYTFLKDFPFASLDFHSKLKEHTLFPMVLNLGIEFAIRFNRIFVVDSEFVWVLQVI